MNRAIKDYEIYGDHTALPNFEEFRQKVEASGGAVDTSNRSKVIISGGAHGSALPTDAAQAAHRYVARHQLVHTYGYLL